MKVKELIKELEAVDAGDSKLVFIDEDGDALDAMIRFTPTDEHNVVLIQMVLHGTMDDQPNVRFRTPGPSE